jgi:hypothetical protein
LQGDTVKIARKIVVVLIVWAWCRPIAAADQYWAYRYHQIDVTAQGSADYARTLAHNLYRLDLSIAAVLQSKASQWRAPTEVYAVPADLFTDFTGQKADIASHSSATSFNSTILINTSVNGENRYWQVYFGFGSSVLGAAYSFRYPQWFIAGLSEVFAASSVERTHVIIGGASPGRVYTLLRGTWIPVQTLLSTRWSDPQMSSKDFREMYYAETWYLVHKIVIDQFYHTNFHHYFERLDRGEDEASAFSGSFDLSIEDLDRAFKKTISGDKFQQLKVTVADEDDGSKAVRLSEAEAKGRLAVYAAEHGVQPGSALVLSAAALKLDAANEDALTARVRAELRVSDPNTAFRDANDMCGRETLSTKLLRTCAFAFATLAHKQRDKALPGGSETELNSKALKFYENEVLLDPEDLQSWHGLATLAYAVHDVEYAKALLPKIAAVQAAHPHVGSLAGSVAGLYSLAGDDDNAMKYALTWQANSISSGERGMAVAYISRLRDYSERKRAAGGANLPN